MNSLCKICPQFAFCLVQPGSPALRAGTFYPQRLELKNEKEIVFRCDLLQPTGEISPRAPEKYFNGVLPLWAVRVPINVRRQG